MKNILVIGSLNMDLVMSTDRIPEVGETVCGKAFNTFPGGKGANQAVAAARLGGNVKMLGAVGNDSYGDVLLRGLKKDGVDVSEIERFDISTGVAVITVCNGDNSIIINRGANGMVTPEYIDRHIEAIKWADYVVMQYEIPMETVLRAAEIASEYGKKVVINPAPMADTPKKLLEIADLFVPNQSESAILLNTQTDEETAVKEIKALGPKAVIITLGSRGCIFYDGADILRIPAVKTQAVDTTAAGDCFIGALVTALSQDDPTQEAIRFATKAASFSVSHEGAQSSLPHKEQL